MVVSGSANVGTSCLFLPFRLFLFNWSDFCPSKISLKKKKYVCTEIDNRITGELIANKEKAKLNI